MKLIFRDINPMVCLAMEKEFKNIADVKIQHVNIKQLNIKSVLTPGLGTLTGKMPPEKAAKQMKKAWDEVIGKHK